jgi:hypothetical protein
VDSKFCFTSLKPDPRLFIGVIVFLTPGDITRSFSETNSIAVKSLKDATDAMGITASTLDHLAQVHEVLESADKAIKLVQKGLEL